MHSRSLWSLLCFFMVFASCRHTVQGPPCFHAILGAKKADSASANAVFTIKLGSLDASSIMVELEIPPGYRGGTADLLNLPGRKERRKFLRNVRCDGVAVSTGREGGWTLPAGCRRLSWNVFLSKLPRGGYRPSSQKAVSDANEHWMFLPGGALFLLPTGIDGPFEIRISAPTTVSIFSSLACKEMKRLLIPKTFQVGLTFIGLGSFRVIKARVGGQELRHLVAGRPTPKLVRLLGSIGEALNYLSGVTGGRAVSGKTLDVYWFPLDRRERSFAGTAGYSALAVNYFREDGPSSQIEDILPVLVVLHEQFHQLIGRGPVWLAESMAHYYALKALLVTRIIGQEKYDEFVMRIKKEADQFPPLLEIQRRYDRTGDMGLYQGFYCRGVLLWHEIDKAIIGRSNGKKSLDDIVVELFDLVYGGHGRPPAAFVKLLVELGGAAVEGTLRSAMSADLVDGCQGAP